MSSEITPNDIVNSFAPGTIRCKPYLNLEAVETVKNRLPIYGDFLDIAGTGDYDHAKTSMGSATLRYDTGIVAKIGLGKVLENADQSPLERAKGTLSSIRHFQEVSPKTLVILAVADDGRVKPVVIQKAFDGRPAGETPIQGLLNLETLKDIRKIFELMVKWQKEHNTFDLNGQKTSKTCLARELENIPFVSDNIMVGRNGGALLVDNILLSRRDKIPKRRFLGKIKIKLKQQIPFVFLTTLIIVRKAYDFLTRNTNTALLVENQNLYIGSASKGN